MAFNADTTKGNIISSVNSTASLLGSGATFTGTWEDVTDYTTVGSAVLGSLSTDGILYFDLSTDAGSTYTSVPNTIGDATFSVPRILNVVETHVRIRYVNGTTAQTGTFAIQTKYSNGQELTLLNSVNDTLNPESPVTPVRASTEFDLDVARKHITGQKSTFFFGFNDSVGTVWEDIHPAGGDINWLQTASTVEVLSSSALDTSGGTGVRSVEIHGLSATGVDQDEIIIMSGVTPVVSSLTYSRINIMHSETCGTYGGSHAGNITCQVSGGGVVLGTMTLTNEAGVQAGTGESSNGFCSIPLGKVAYLTSLTVISDISGTKTIDIALYEREDLLDVTVPFSPRRALWEESGIQETPPKVFKSHIKIKSLTDIFFRAKSSSGTSKIEVSLDYYVVDADSSGA